MKITCIICSYNQAKYLEDAILSVIHQDYANKEIILIDGGSDDGSIEIIQKYKEFFDYYVSEEDRGQTHAINKGIDRSTGDIVGWLNSDDIYLPGCFKKVFKAFKLRPKTKVVHGNRVMLDAEGNLDGWSCSGPFTPKTKYYNICSETAFWRSEMHATGARLKEELSFAMDLEWFTRLYAEHGDFHYINNFLGGFRCYPENKSSTMDDVKWEEGPREWERLLGFKTPPHESHGWEQNWALLKPRYTLYPAIMKKLFNRPVSVVPARLS